MWLALLMLHPAGTARKEELTLGISSGEFNPRHGLEVMGGSQTGLVK